MARYPDIGDHGLIGDLQTAALMSTCCSKSSLPVRTIAPLRLSAATGSPVNPIAIF